MYRMSFKTILFLGLITGIFALGPAAWADSNDNLDEASFPTEMADLASRSDLAVLGRAIEVKSGQADARVKIKIEKTFRGVAPGELIWLATKRGKIKVDMSEPEFRAGDRAILFLYQDREAAGPEPLFRCVNGAEGKKSVIHENVYLHPDNGFATVKLKDYEKAFLESQKA